MSEIVDLKSAGLRPLLLRGINRIWPGTPTLNANKLLSAAMKQARSEDLGEDWTVEPLEKQVTALNEEADLSPVGAFIMGQRIKSALVTRLNAIKLINAHPDILDLEVAPIWLITGLQRTGTTYLQRLLAGDQFNRSIFSWEALDPVPNGGRMETGKRIRKARLSENALKWMSPGFFAIHPVDHLGPEEDVLLLDPTFLSTAPEAMAHVPGFGLFLEEEDHTRAYRWEEKMLKVLQWQRPANRWILKSPHHLEHLEAFIKVFPDTKVIWTHRDPAESLPSFLSMVYHGRAMFSDRVSIHQVRDHWLRKSVLMTGKGIEFQRRHPDRVADLAFGDLVDDPVGAIRSIYSKFGERLSESGEDGVRNIVTTHERHRFGIHRYDAGSFELDKKAIEAQFADYYHFLNNLHAK